MKLHKIKLPNEPGKYRNLVRGALREGWSKGWSGITGQFHGEDFLILSKVIDIQNFLNLVIKHYPNYMRITDELQLVVNSIDNEVSKRSYHGNKIQNMEPSFWILFPGQDNGDEIWHICPII